MHLHKNILDNICDGNIQYYIEYMDSLKLEIKNTIKGISAFLKNSDIVQLRANVHKLISIICYLEKNDELLHICKYILFEPKPNEAKYDIANYIYYTNELLKYDIRVLF
jgi:hypothetical protein